MPKVKATKHTLAHAIDQLKLSPSQRKWLDRYLDMQVALYTEHDDTLKRAALLCDAIVLAGQRGTVVTEEARRARRAIETLRLSCDKDIMHRFKNNGEGL